MSLTTPNFNSLADAVTAIHALRRRAVQGENVTTEMSDALTVVNGVPCFSGEDALALLEVVRMLLDDIVCRNAGNAENKDAVLAAHSWLYLDKAISHLELLRSQYERQAGAAIN